MLRLMILLCKLSTAFKIRDHGRPRFFLGIEAIYSNDAVVLSQRRYMTELLRKAGMESCKPLAIAISNTTSKAATGSALLDDPTPYRQLVESLMYLLVTRLDCRSP